MYIFLYIGVQISMMNYVCICMGLSVCRMCSVSESVNLQLTLAAKLSALHISHVGR